MSGQYTRPAHLRDATVTDRHRQLAEAHADIAECPGDYTETFIVVVGGTLIGVIGGYGWPAEAGKPALGIALAALSVVVGIASWFRVAHNQRLYAQQLWARSLAYLEGLRGKELDRQLLRWCAERHRSSIIDVARDASAIADEVGADRTHQLMVRAEQTKDYGLFSRLYNASMETSPNGWSRNARRADGYTAVVDVILASREPVGSIVDIERMLDAVDRQRVNVAL